MCKCPSNTSTARSQHCLFTQHVSGICACVNASLFPTLPVSASHSSMLHTTENTFTLRTAARFLPRHASHHGMFPSPCVCNRIIPTLPEYCLFTQRLFPPQHVPGICACLSVCQCKSPSNTNTARLHCPLTLPVPSPCVNVRPSTNTSRFPLVLIASVSVCPSIFQSVPALPASQHCLSVSVSVCPSQYQHCPNTACFRHPRMRQSSPCVSDRLLLILPVPLRTAESALYAAHFPALPAYTARSQRLFSVCPISGIRACVNVRLSVYVCSVSASPCVNVRLSVNTSQSLSNTSTSTTTAW
ncbi:hypothetical protein NECID01_2154 [Nematocida sp. AWRm77]|nr:hypothetical protein NECID01_2154 [Nematocida sp. AWRm77]